MEEKQLVRKNEKITIMEAYLAFYQFLDDLYARTQSDAVGVTLGELSLLPDGGPLDPGSWEDWLDVVDRAKNGTVDARLILTKASSE